MKQHFEKWERLVWWRPVIEGELEPGVVFHRAVREEDVEGDYQLEADVECGGEAEQSICVKWGKSDVDRRRRSLRNKLPR